MLANDVVDAAKCRWKASLNVHTIFGRDYKNPESPLEDTNDALNDIAELSVAKIIALLRCRDITVSARVQL